MNTARNPEICWSPAAEAVEQTHLSRFIRLASNQAPQVTDYDSLYAWSIAQPADFWPLVWRYCEVKAGTDWQQVLQHPQAMPGAVWFAGARLNFAENLLRHRDQRRALVYCDEDDRQRTLTYAQLYQQVARYAAALRRLGVRRGDRVAGYLPNIPEAVIAMLASASIGAVWSSCSPDFGLSGVLERFSRIAPKVLFAVDGYRYAGKTFRILDKVAGLAERIDSLEQVVVIPFLQAQPEVGSIRGGVLADAWAVDGEALEFEQLPFDHPLYILYSSGTTGAPKCIVHGAGGTLLQHLKEQWLHTDLQPQDVLFYFTSCGWMMWNWLVSGLTSGCCLVLYHGAPLHPDRGRLWQLAEQLGVSIFGTSAGYISALAKAGVRPAQEYDLSALRTLLSTGSPLAAEGFDYVYRHIKSDLMLSSISGGTDIISCFVLGNPTRPVYRGEIQGRGLGMAVAVYDAAGKPVLGQRGELVCTRPFPSMPLGFWNQPDADYHAAYFSRFDGVWTQGDFAELTPQDGMIIYGRSDALLNPGGVRIGTAEIYRQAEKAEAVLESVCVGQIWGSDTRIILFVVLRDGAVLDAALEQHIRTLIAHNASKRHVPAKIIAVPEIPRTLSGKIVELAVKNVVHGQPVKNIDALANPQALEYFRNLKALSEP